MSFCRAVHLPVTSSATMLRFVSSKSCGQSSQTLRAFSSYGNVHASSKRDMQTATAYRPHSLPSSFPPPGKFESIPGDFALGPEPLQRQKPQQSEASPTKITNGAQQSVSTSSPTSKPAEKPRRKLRPRKAAMKLTPIAIEQLRKLLSQPEPKLIRVGVKNRGCSGLAYHLEYVEKPGTFDEVVEQDGVKVLIDSKALFSIIGSEMDWQSDKLSQRFIFKNPNIKESCGCGESFMV